MLSRLYIEALLADTELADSIYSLWECGILSDPQAATLWSAISRGDLPLLRL